MIGNRIKSVRECLALTQEEFATRIGISRGALSRLESAQNNPAERTIKLICREFGVNLDYLLHGEEPMFAPKDVTALDKIEQHLTGDNPFVKAVFMELASLSDQEWEVMYKFMKKVVEDTQKETGR